MNYRLILITLVSGILLTACDHDPADPTPHGTIEDLSSIIEPGNVFTAPAILELCDGPREGMLLFTVDSSAQSYTWGCLSDHVKRTETYCASGREITRRTDLLSFSSGCSGNYGAVGYECERESFNDEWSCSITVNESHEEFVCPVEVTGNELVRGVPAIRELCTAI